MVWWIAWILTISYFFGGKRHKAIVVSSKTFQIPLEMEDIVSAARPTKISDEAISLEYDKATFSTPLDFCNQKNSVLQDIKSKYNPIAIFWIAEMFIFFWIGYYLQDSVHIKWYRKLKEGQISFLWNPWSWTWFFSLKWRLWIYWWYKAIFNWYRIKNYTTSLSNGSEIILAINISHKSDNLIISQNFPWLNIIEFGIRKPESAFLINESQVETFYKKIKNLMQRLDHDLWPSWKIHIISNLPVPFCIKLGQAIHRNWPECIFYDFDRTSNTYIKTISTQEITI
jgi:hypothetical protein